MPARRSLIAAALCLFAAPATAETIDVSDNHGVIEFGHRLAAARILKIL